MKREIEFVSVVIVHSKLDVWCVFFRNLEDQLTVVQVNVLSWSAELDYSVRMFRSRIVYTAEVERNAVYLPAGLARKLGLDKTPWFYAKD